MTQRATMMQPATLFLVAAVRDAAGTTAGPGAVAVDQGRVLASGETTQVKRAVAGLPCRVVEMPRSLLLPGFVNAHAHLGLTALGPRAYPGSFTDWLRRVIRDAPSPEEPDSLAKSIRAGVIFSRQAGVAYVGDIATSSRAVMDRIPALTPGQPGVHGVGFLECFGIAEQQQHDAIAKLETDLSRLESVFAGTPQASAELRLGIQPHAPYSAGLGLYLAAARIAARHGYRLSTHLAETPEEVEFVAHARGPFADMLRDLGKWDDSIRPTGLHPVEWLEPALKLAPWLLAHGHYLDDQHIEILARCGASIAYCPIASDYFGHHQPQRNIVHRYRDLMAAGVNVCLGTDSMVCQGYAGRENQAELLGIFRQMRYLHRRDATDPDLLLRMGTVHGMRALGFPPAEATLQPGSRARLTAVDIDPCDPRDPLLQALTNTDPLRPVAGF
jgi:cytosine/adenosine deaminase-related metal-dependent hydrolase